MTMSRESQRAARRLQAQLDIKYTRALHIVEADRAATTRRREHAEADPAAALAPATKRLVTAAVNDWLTVNLPTVAPEVLGLAVPFEWLTEAAIESAGALALAEVHEEALVDGQPGLLVSTHTVFLMVSGWIAGNGTQPRRREVEMRILEEHFDGKEVIVGPLPCRGEFRVEVLPGALDVRVHTAAFRWDNV